jgi:hypothetical protein
LAALVVLLATTSACTHVWHAPQQPLTTFPPGATIPLDVVFHVPPEMRRAGWQRDFGGDTWKLEMGPFLADSSAAMVAAAFRNANAVDAASDHRDPRVVVTARKVQVVPAFMGGYLAVQVEWSVCDAQGQEVWREQVCGVHTAGGSWRTVMKGATQDLLDKTLAALRSSPEVRRLHR